MKKLVVMILSVAITLIYASCSAGTPAAPGTEAVAPVQTADSDSMVPGTDDKRSMEDKRAETKDTLPAVKFDGAAFSVSSMDGTAYELFTEETDGDITSAALQKRNQRVEERFDIVIEPIMSAEADPNAYVKAIKTELKSEDDIYDVVKTQAFATGTLVLGDLYNNWLNMPYTDFSQPWWINDVNDCFRVGDAIYTAAGDMCLSTMQNAYGVFFNTDLANDYVSAVGDVYGYIDRGEWTIDRFNSIVKSIYTDSNGNGRHDADDVHGFTAETASNLDVYTFAFDIPITKKNSDGKPELVFNNSKTVSAIEKVYDLYWNGNGSYITSDYLEPITTFVNGKAVFLTTYIAQTSASLRDMKDDFIILPYPKFSEEQRKYLTGVLDSYSVLGIPVTVKDTEFASLITEAINIESYKLLYPVYYEDALRGKYTSLDQPVELLDMLIQGRTFDFITPFSWNITGMSWLFRDTIAAKSTDFVSGYMAWEGQASEGLAAILEAYEKNAG